MMLVSMVQRSNEKQQDTLCTRVKLLRGELQKTEYQMCPSWKPVEVFVKNRWLWAGRRQRDGYLRRQVGRGTGLLRATCDSPGRFSTSGDQQVGSVGKTPYNNTTTNHIFKKLD